MIIVPPYLQPGDSIGLLCPSGTMPLDRMQTCITTLEQWSFRVVMGNTLGSMFNYFSGTDEERLADLQTMLDNKSLRAILCARGGYGLSRIIDRIDFTAFLQHPKWIVGFSDITVLHSHLYQNYGVASLHSPMAAAFNDGGSEGEYITSLRYALQGHPSAYHCSATALNITGTASGELVGGNLSLLAHMVGSVSSIDTKGKLLFIEDVGEYIYNIDRMMIQLQRAGKLDGLAGLIVGSFTDMKDTVIPFGASVYDVIYEKVKDYGYPVCFHFPVGHSPQNYALKHGVMHTLEVGEHRTLLTEMH